MQKKQPPKIIILIFILIGLYFFLVGIFPIQVEISPAETGMKAQIHRKSMIPPFKNIDIIIPNVKQASVNVSRSSNGQITYRVELEDFQGYRFPLSSYFSSGYHSKVILQDKINASIRNRIEFKDTIYQLFFVFFGLIFIIIPLLILIAVSKTSNNKIQQSQPHVKPQGVPIPQQTKQPESEQEKYKDINDSIIR